MLPFNHRYLQSQSEEKVAEQTGTPGNSETEAVESQISETVEKIERQEERVENASTPAEANKEQAKLDSLIERFDSLVARLDRIDERLAEPTVPAPPAKQEVKTEETTAVEETPAGTTDEPPRKRRLGAW
jgi:predicted  nucleic acid-binding Zn-ribbon protein